MLATAGAGGVVLWDRASGREVRRFPTEAARGGRVVLSPDGSRLAVFGDGLTLWDVKTGRLLHRLTAEKKSWINGLTFSPEGANVVLIDHDAARTWEAASGKEIETARRRSLLRPGEVHLALGGNRLAAMVCWRPPVRIVDLATGKERFILKGVESHGAGRLAMTPDGRLLAVGVDNVVRLFDPATGAELRAIETPFERAPETLALTADGKVLAVSGTDAPAGGGGSRRLLLYDTATGKDPRSLPLEEGPDEDPVALGQLTFSPDGRTLASWAHDGSPPGGRAGTAVHLWDVATGKRLHAGGNGTEIEAVVFAGDGKTVATRAHGSGLVRVWDVGTGKERLRTRGFCLALSPDGRTFVTNGDTPASLRLWDLAGGKEIAQWQALRGDGEDKGVGHAAFTPDGKRLLTAGRDDTYDRAAGPICIWEMPARKEVRRVGAFVDVLAISADGKRALARTGKAGGMEFGSNCVWDLETGRTAPVAGDLKEVFVSSFDLSVLSPDGRTLAVLPSVGGLALGVLGLWDVDAGRMVHELREGNGSARCLAFSPDGTTAASAGREEETDRRDEVSLWDVRTGKGRGRFTTGQGGVESLAFSPDGKRLATGGDDSTTLIWDLGVVLTPGPRD
jgi:WD40 repeat protein